MKTTRKKTFVGSTYFPFSTNSMTNFKLAKHFCVLPFKLHVTVSSRFKNVKKPMIALKIKIEDLKLTEEIKLLIHEHCISLPHDQSHYSLEHTSLKYFQDSSLCLNTLYAKFCRFSEERKGINAPPIGLSTYSKYFNYFVNFTFDRPRTDVCNDCFEYQKKRRT